MKCNLCKKDLSKGYYERVGGIDYYYHESCKNTTIKQFLDENEEFKDFHDEEEVRQEQDFQRGK